MAIDNVRLPVSVEMGAQGGPRFKTTTQVSLSGLEQRVAEWDDARCEYDIAYKGLTKVDLMAIVKIFRARQGPAYPFRFKDWSDYQASNEIGEGDGSETSFQLIKKYDDGIVQVSRTIQLPVTGTVVISVNDVLQTETTHYTVDYATGLVTFVSPPGSGHDIDATFEFDVPVRFAKDNLDISMIRDDLAELSSINLIEVLGE